MQKIYVVSGYDEARTVSKAEALKDIEVLTEALGILKDVQPTQYPTEAEMDAFKQGLELVSFDEYLLFDESEYVDLTQRLKLQLEELQSLEDAEITNEQRVEFASRALSVSPYDESGDEAVLDLLADLMHYCQHKKIRFEALLSGARDNFEKEAGK